MRKILITGGAGFIGCNAAKYFSGESWKVFIYDNLSRKGSRLNLQWLNKTCDATFVKGDVRDFDKTAETVCGVEPDVILHLAAQVAVTTSVENPREDFEINAQGTLNVLESARRQKSRPFFIYSSTNKVYGKMENEEIIDEGTRYAFARSAFGIAESHALDFHSPYGCSKGAADQYVRDYSRIYGVPSVVLRQSCIYGTRQFGVEDQGWIAWFIVASLLNKSITIYGDGKQIRDVLYVDDLISLYGSCIARKDIVRGKIYNVGGGTNFTLSLLELVGLIEKYSGKKVKYSFSDWRPGDQKVYVSDIRSITRDIGWKPAIDPQKGVEELYQWAAAHLADIGDVAC